MKKVQETTLEGKIKGKKVLQKRLEEEKIFQKIWEKNIMNQNKLEQKLWKEKSRGKNSRKSFGGKKKKNTGCSDLLAAAARGARRLSLHGRHCGRPGAARRGPELVTPVQSSSRGIQQSSLCWSGAAHRGPSVLPRWRGTPSLLRPPAALDWI